MVCRVQRWDLLLQVERQRRAVVALRAFRVVQDQVVVAEIIQAEREIQVVSHHQVFTQEVEEDHCLLQVAFLLVFPL